MLARDGVSSLPLPPADLAARVGLARGADPLTSYVSEGERLRELIERLLPDGWDWHGKRVLDFGCGSARVLRHFTVEAQATEFIGCDIDEPSIAWAAAHLSPPFRLFHNALAPPLPLEDGSLDLVWALSVFTHISDTWSAWMTEMHRVLKPGGLLLVSFLGAGMWDTLVGEPYREDDVGMAVLQAWEGPFAWVFHSEWWLREHWGRAFEIVDIALPEGQITHSYLVLQRRDVHVTAEGLERIEPTEPRELAGLQTSLRLARRDIAQLAARETELLAAQTSLEQVRTIELLRLAATRLATRAQRTFRANASRP